MTIVVDTSYIDTWYAEWRIQRQKEQRHATAEERGVPVPRTGVHHWHSKKNRAGRSNGVMGGSRILPHRYMDEGDKGSAHRREVKRKERAAWKAEARQEMTEWLSCEAEWDLYDPEEAWDDTDPNEGYCSYCGGPCEL